jgi:glycosyltransferase involved in cell wall biosynthesis
MIRKIHVNALTGGYSVPSARFRVRQLIPYLEALNIEVCEYPSIFGQYPPKQLVRRPLWFTGAIIERSARSILIRNQNRPTILQRPFISSMSSSEWLLKNYFFDVDDAIWFQFDGSSDTIARNSAAVVCGNDYIYEHYVGINSNCILIPTCVDINKWKKIGKLADNENDTFVIGWSGTSPGLKYLYSIENELLAVLNKIPNSRLVVTCNIPPSFRGISSDQYKYIPWSPANEVSTIQSFNVGLMPLFNTDFEKGKCSYKLLLYSSVGIPALGSAVGMNIPLSEQGGCITAQNNSDWFDILCELHSNRDLSRRIGERGRACVEKFYSCEIGALQWSKLIREFGSAG